MEKQLIFFDIDGTLIDSHTGKVPASTIHALQKLRAAGHTLCVATGRGLRSLKEGNIDTVIDWNGYVCNTGQILYDHEQKLIFERYIDPKAVHQLLELAEKEHLILLIEGLHESLITKEADSYVIQTHEFSHEIIPPVKPYTDFPVIMMMIFADIGYDYSRFQTQGVRIIPGMSTFADVIIDGFSKVSGIEEMMKQLHFDQYICFGDSLNDIEMAKHATYSICMGNGHEELKQISDYITSDVDDDGIWNACVKLGLFAL